MRKLQEAIKQVKQFARDNSHIRGLVFRGSLIMNSAKIDRFTDIDPLFYVDTLDAFIEDESWIDYFGKPIARFTDEIDNKHGGKVYTRLLILEDGFKLDVSFEDIKYANFVNDMKLYRVILDKDNLFPKQNTSSESHFFIDKPTEDTYHQILNEFFFDTSYVTKSLRRNELFFTRYMYGILNQKIKALLAWYLGIQQDFQVNIGAEGRYIFDLLDSKVKQMVLDTFAGKTYQDNIDALYAYYDLVGYLGRYIEQYLSFSYLYDTEEAMLQYIKDAETVPIDISEEITL
ncbi:MAG: aminoglycoside 6-adenylyltransferase [Candidatus Izimaplasma sp.]|nr:aminoglycoside 6-adenylyltransferase [Candidatus Izimaplasma bacterium]